MTDTSAPTPRRRRSTRNGAGLRGQGPVLPRHRAGLADSPRHAYSPQGHVTLRNDGAGGRNEWRTGREDACTGMRGTSAAMKSGGPSTVPSFRPEPYTATSMSTPTPPRAPCRGSSRPPRGSSAEPRRWLRWRRTGCAGCEPGGARWRRSAGWAASARRRSRCPGCTGCGGSTPTASCTPTSVPTHRRGRSTRKRSSPASCAHSAWRRSACRRRSRNGWRSAGC